MVVHVSSNDQFGMFEREPVIGGEIAFRQCKGLGKRLALVMRSCRNPFAQLVRGVVCRRNSRLLLRQGLFWLSRNCRIFFVLGQEPPLNATGDNSHDKNYQEPTEDHQDKSRSDRTTS